MQIPIDVKAVLDAAGDIDEARKIPVSVSVYLDRTAPGDLQECIRRAFASSEARVRVLIDSYDDTAAIPDSTCDLAVIAAGFSEGTGTLAAQIRAVGVPVMVATTMPDIVSRLASSTSAAIPAADLIAPVIDVDSSALPETAAVEGFDAEPYPLTIDRSASLLLRMGEWVVATFREKRLAFALAFPFVRKPLSMESVRSTAVQNAGVGLVMFIPGADMPVMTLNQAKMLLQIAAAYGQPLGMERVKELAAVVGGGFAFRAVARQLIGVVPALGWAVKAGIGYTGTVAMGRAAIEYFEGGGNMSAFADTIARARDAAVRTAGDVRHNPVGVIDKVRDAAGSATSSAGAVARKTVDTAKSVVETVSDSTGIPVDRVASDTLHQVADSLRSRSSK